MDITRRGFVGGAAAAAAAAAIAPAVEGALASEAAQDPAPAEADAAVSFKPGVYTASSQGKRGPVTVQAEFSEDRIVSVEVVSDTETEDLTYVAKTVVPQAIVATQSLGVDTVAGATLTSMAIIAAAADCAEQAGVDSQALRDRDASVAGIAQAMTPGTYQGESHGMWKEGSINIAWFGASEPVEPTRVEVEVDGTSVKSVTVLASSDTDGFREPAVELVPQEIVDQQSLYVDAAAGCTMTSAAITSAVAKALAEAGADLAGFAKRPRRDAPQDAEYSCDLAVVGGGTCGTMAALTAAREGLSVVVVERNARVGGTGACATGPMCVGSQVLRDNGVDTTADEVFAAMMAESRWKTNAPLVRNWVSHAGEMADTLQESRLSIGDPGFQFMPSGDPKNLTEFFNAETAGSTKMFADLYDQIIVPAGGVLLKSTRAEKLLTDGEGAVVGVEATDLMTGGRVTVHAGAVAVCTGGFAGSESKMRELLGSANFYVFGMTNNVGDGLDMCRELGCNLSEELEPSIGEFCANAKCNYYAGYMQNINQCGFLALDPQGNRFMNEELFLTEELESGGSAFRRAGHCYFILTESDLQSLEEHGVHGLLSEDYIEANGVRCNLSDGYPAIVDEMEDAIAKGEAFKADTLEGLRDAAGFDAEAFDATIEAYQQVIADGEDPLFGKSAELIQPLDEGPFYAVHCIPPVFHTYNGIKVDAHFRPLVGDDQLPAVKGLYVGGQDSGGAFTYPYTNYLGSMSSYALTSGMLIAQEAKKYLGK